jgi:hypothetical protein
MTYTLLEHSWDWATDQGAPDSVASAYATEITAEVGERADCGLLAVDHPACWPAWCERNLSRCFQCGGNWALWCPDATPQCWECQVCMCSRPAPGGIS